MLIEVKRHGYSFWEAPHRIGLAFEAPDPRKLRRMKMWDRFMAGDPGPLKDMHGKPAKPITAVNDPKLWGKLLELVDSVEPEMIDSRIVEADFNREGNQRLIADIQTRVLAAFGLTWIVFMKSDRIEAKWARMASMALCRNTIEGVTTEEIGRAHSRDRTVVARAARRCEARRRKNGAFAAAMGRVETGLLLNAA